MLIRYNGEPEIGTIIDHADLSAVQRELDKFRRQDYNHHETIEQFESKFAQMVGNKYAVAVSSCAVGIDMLLNNLSFEHTDEVLSCAINFHGTHLSIINSGAKLVMVNPSDDLNIDVEDLKRRITPHTKAIVVTHMNGLSCDMQRIEELVAGSNIKIIEDAARSLGSKYLGSMVGNHSWACVYSFQYKKMITTLGEGGMIVTCDKQLYEELKKIRSFGLGEGWGTNYKMTSVQAAMGISQLAKLDMLVFKRRVLAKYRTERIKNKLSAFCCPKDDAVFFNSYYLYTVLTPHWWGARERDELLSNLEAAGVKCVVANTPTYRKNKYIAANCSVSDTIYAEQIGNRIICLPIHPDMSMEENEYITNEFIAHAEFIDSKYF